MHFFLAHFFFRGGEGGVGGGWVQQWSPSDSFQGFLLNYSSRAVAKELLKTGFGAKPFWGLFMLNGEFFGRRTSALKKLMLHA